MGAGSCCGVGNSERVVRLDFEMSESQAALYPIDWSCRSASECVCFVAVIESSYKMTV